MSWQVTDRGPGAVVLSDGRYRLRLAAYGARVMRVTQTGREAFLRRDDPMITAAPEGALTVAGDEGHAVISAGALEAVIDLGSGALTWRAGGETLMREPDEAGRVLREIDIVRYRDDPDAPMTERVGVDGLRTDVRGEPYVDRPGYQTRLSFVFEPDERIYGLGQHEEGLLNYRGQHQFLYQHNLKIACPVIVSSRGWAVLNNCCGAQIFHDDAFGSYLSADSADEMDYFVIAGGSLDGVVAGLRHLTGDAPLLPRWALGYVQSKEHYHTADELVDVAKRYREAGIGLDCVVQDWLTWPAGLWGQKTVDPARYPDLKGTVDALHGMNVRLMWSIWPNLNGDGPNRRELAARGLMLGNRSTYDAFDPAARALYWAQCREQLYASGVDAWWCDCTEPFEFDWYGETKLFPEDRYAANVGQFKRYLDPTQVLAYSLWHSRGIYEGQRAEGDGKRVTILTRSGLTGQQRYGTIVWNGDTSASWDTLRRSIPDGLNLAVCGLPYWTVDAGAFFVKKWSAWFGAGRYERGCDDPAYRELYVRWLQLGALLPMMRSHGTDTPREIWRFGQPGETYYDAIAAAIRLRYRLMPYIYSEMAAVRFERGTMLRMLAFDFAHDPQALDVSDQFMFGRSIMAAPIVAPGGPDGVAERAVYLPAGTTWCDFYTGERFLGGQWITVSAPLDRIPLFVRAGTLVPTGPDVRFADENGLRDVTVRVYPGADAAYTLYNDAGDGYAYEQGAYTLTRLHWDDAARRLTAAPEGSAEYHCRTIRSEIVG